MQETNKNKQGEKKPSAQWTSSMQERIACFIFNKIIPAWLIMATMVFVIDQVRWNLK